MCLESAAALLRPSPQSAFCLKRLYLSPLGRSRRHPHYSNPPTVTRHAHRSQPAFWGSFRGRPCESIGQTVSVGFLFGLVAFCFDLGLSSGATAYNSRKAVQFGFHVLLDFCIVRIVEDTPQFVWDLLIQIKQFPIIDFLSPPTHRSESACAVHWSRRNGERRYVLPDSHSIGSKMRSASHPGVCPSRSGTRLSPCMSEGISTPATCRGRFRGSPDLKRYHRYWCPASHVQASGSASGVLRDSSYIHRLSNQPCSPRYQP